jgi:hypothetical protein
MPATPVSPVSAARDCGTFQGRFPRGEVPRAEGEGNQAVWGRFAQDEEIGVRSMGYVDRIVTYGLATPCRQA